MFPKKSVSYFLITMLMSKAKNDAFGKLLVTKVFNDINC